MFNLDLEKLFPRNSTLIVALSGGPDSLFLLHVLCELRESYPLTIIAAHLDHGWRVESPQDVAFCKDVARRYSCEFVSAHARDIPLIKKYKQATEELGRALRRTFLESVANKYQDAFIVLGHHQGDQQETFFIRLLRGASLSGLTGMKVKVGRYVRPLLFLSKACILDYLAEKKISYLIDQTNSSPVYLRNRIRSTVIPALEQADSRFTQNFQTTVTQLQEIETFLITFAENSFKEIHALENTKITVNLTKLLALDFVLFKYVLLHWLCVEKVSFTPTAAFFKEIHKFLSHTTNSTKHSVHKGWSFLKKQQKVTIVKDI